MLYAEFIGNKSDYIIIFIQVLEIIIRQNRLALTFIYIRIKNEQIDYLLLEIERYNRLLFFLINSFKFISNTSRFMKYI